MDDEDEARTSVVMNESPDFLFAPICISPRREIYEVLFITAKQPRARKVALCLSLKASIAVLNVFAAFARFFG